MRRGRGRRRRDPWRARARQPPPQPRLPAAAGEGAVVGGPRRWHPPASLDALRQLLRLPYNRLFLSCRVCTIVRGCVSMCALACSSSHVSLHQCLRAYMYGLLGSRRAPGRRPGDNSAVRLPACRPGPTASRKAAARCPAGVARHLPPYKGGRRRGAQGRPTLCTAATATPACACARSGLPFLPTNSVSAGPISKSGLCSTLCSNSVQNSICQNAKVVPSH
jgi:hypothetical protein